ncbi:MAG: 1-(5-phosphoribosyl)-5-amino-4-imidazole-carboxylate carboxylase, partial [Nitrospinales bacterium]|nr:1-(5-phosphoribosyl)-5-amino-4-imidazole-carboxylate carboxylase [Nitrospinales bacterium]
MDKNKLQTILRDLYNQKLSPDEAVDQLSTLPYENLGFAKIDHHRSLRSDLPEVVYVKVKKEDQLISIIKSLYKANSDILVTKLDSNVYENIRLKLPSGYVYDDTSLTLVL